LPMILKNQELLLPVSDLVLPQQPI